MYKTYEVSNAVKDYMMDYSKNVIVDRAIVFLEDGLKPSQRLELWSLYDKNITHKKKRIKGLTATGEAMKYVPHGDSSVFEAMARMGQKDTFLYPLIDGKGNLGQHASKEVRPSAPRYVEMRLTEFAEEMFKDIDKNSVNFVSNFDNTKKQPVVLPTRFPSVLTFGSSGIAVGFASNIPSFNLKEVCQYTINTIKGEETTYLVPDFATKGEIIYNESELKKIEDSGDGKVTLRGTYYTEGNIIIIDTIPFSTNVEAIIDKIIELVKQGKLKEIKNVRYGTDKDGTSIEIDIKNNTNVELLMAKIYRLTPLQNNFSCNMNVIYKDKPVKMGTKSIVKAWVDFRRNTVKRIAEFDLNKVHSQLNYLYALEKIILDIDKCIYIIKNSETEKEAIAGLMKEFDIDEDEANNVANIKLRNLNKSYLNSKVKNIEQLEKQVSSLNTFMVSEELIDNAIIKDLEYIINKYNKERQTEIVYEDKLIKIAKEVTQVENYNTRIFVTEQGYIKKVMSTSLRGSSTHKLKDGDKIIQEFDSTNKSELIFFVSGKEGNRVYKRFGYEIDDHKVSTLGEYIYSLLELDTDDKIHFVCSTEDYKENLLIGWDSGKMSKISINAYATSTNRKMLKNGFSDKDDPVFLKLITDNIDVVAVSSINKIVLMNTININVKASKTATGQFLQRQKDDSKTIGYYTLDQVDFADSEYYRIASSGVGKYLKKTDSLNK